MIKGRHKLEHVLEQIDIKYIELYTVLAKKYNNKLSCGNRRICFYTGRGFVVKIPWRYKGELDNLIEARDYSAGKPYAKCKLTYIVDIPVLVMEELTSADHISLFPEWVKGIDSSQVGFNRKGQLVAYDYAMVRGRNI